MSNNEHMIGNKYITLNRLWISNFPSLSTPSLSYPIVSIIVYVNSWRISNLRAVAMFYIECMKQWIATLASDVQQLNLLNLPFDSSDVCHIKLHV